MMSKIQAFEFNLKTIEKAAEDLIKAFPDARIFAFEGEMGAGKTTFIKAICRKLGVEQVITSPTFAIVNEYIDKDGEKVFFHFDFYRIENIGEALDMGYEDYFYSDKMCFIEWPEKIAELLPPGTINLKIEVIDEENRKLGLINN
ncbi:MAG: tRNA (adenosine(37)-N6)-threonylcarbamoyltransferase complex ATPase subunit type 1 TsaE [Bacteroidales bacterium]